MKPKMMLALAVTLGIAGSSLADDKAIAEVREAIKVLNEAFEKQDAAAIKRLMADDHVAITPYYGLATKADQLKSLADFKLSEYVASDMKISLVSPDVALVTYRLATKGSFKGKSLARMSYASALWVRRDGKWLEAAYQETPVGGK